MTIQPEWQGLRAQFPVFEKWAYFAWASVAAVSARSAEAMQNQVAGVRDAGVAPFRDWYQAYEGVRAEAAKMIGSDVDEIAMVKNTGEGVSTIAFGCELKAGDNVVLPRGEFPANAYPWLALAERGIEVRRVDICEDGSYQVPDVERLLDDRTRIVALSFVNYSTGFRADLEGVGRLCRERGALFFVDAIQGLGALPLDVRKMNIDALAADGHKWLCGPEGIGVLFVRKEWQDRVNPLSRGWWSVKVPGRYELDDQPLCDNARRFECGTLTTVAAYGLRAALALINEVGVEAMTARIRSLADTLDGRLVERGFKVVRPNKPEVRSGIVSFEVPGEHPKVLARRLEDDGILVNPRDGRIRAAVHAWNDESDIDRLVKAL